MASGRTAPSSETLRTATNLVNERRLDEASQLLRDAIATAESSELWNDWAVVQLALAERAFLRAFELDPWNLEAAANLGILLFSMGKIAEAESFLREGALTAQGPLRDHIELLLQVYAPPQIPVRSAPASAGSTPAFAAPAHSTKRKTVVECDVDLVVQAAFFPDPAYRGTMIEVGAAKPDYLSVSATFRARGWRVISIEPNPYFCEIQRRHGIDVLQYACGDTDKDDVSFFVVRTDATYQGEPVTNESFSSLGIRGKYAEMMKSVRTSTDEIKVKVRRLDTILREHAHDLGEVDVVCIDVEGWELEVLSGFSFALHNPKLLIVENLFLEPAYVEYFVQRGYTLWQRLEPNDIFVRCDVAAAEPHQRERCYPFGHPTTEVGAKLGPGLAHQPSTPRR
jgi:FkbM family methyltransferase